MLNWLSNHVFELLGLLAGIGAIPVSIGIYLHSHWKEALGDRESLRYYRPALEDTSRRTQYKWLLSHALDRARQFFGPPGGFRAFSICVGIALFYPLLFFLLTWIVSGSHTMGVVELLPDDWQWWERGLFALGFAVYLYIMYLLVRHHEAIDAWVDQQLARFLPRLSAGGRRMVVAVGVGGAVGVIAYGTSGSFAFAVAGAFAVAVAGAGAFAVAAYLTGGWAEVFGADNLSILVFFVVLPLFNGFLDWCSWAASRTLGAYVRRHDFHAWRVLAVVVIDLVLAVFFLAALAALLGTGAAGLDALAETTTGEAVLDLDLLIAQAAANPLGDGLWIMAMLVSTLIPTILHAAIACASIFTLRSKPERRATWLRMMDEVEAGKEEELPVYIRSKIASYLLLHRWMLAALLTFILTGIGAAFMFYVDAPAALLAVVEAARSVVGG